MNTIFDSIRRIRFRRGPQRILGGIAGGIASRFGINVWLVRLLVLVSFLLPVIGWILYVVIWIVTPWRDNSIPLERILEGKRPPKR
ncbi:MAG TPA: PspC domain-containing protein [Enteractinococcus helveticum]|uniref:PspC domain-containing protein n=1 Tax=Enteractinococcus helveticum TaxID=1837282 RepID=A0A921FKV9_9MICC|nr:PspC domain-containing protein [Enteractinococcus helveticum]HJF13690.1 PspC domain-containing protein [Enteractinococcus helveticum]